jgi:hypothetical protein
VITLESNVGHHKILLDARKIGTDILVTIYGGDEHHIGGVAIAYPTKSHYRNTTTISVNTMTFPGHKDYLVANTAAEQICKALSNPVVVSVGIHMNNASKDEIKQAVDAVDTLVKKLIDQYQNAE